jgi:predicted dinucleotide-binding enzyme
MNHKGKQMRITVLGTGRIGSTVGRLWHPTGHEVTFAAQDATGPHALAEELGERAHAAAVAEAVAAAEVVLVAIPGPAVVDALTAAGSLDGQVVIDAANTMGKDRLWLRQLANTFPRARWARALNTLQARVLADEHHRQPRWVLILSGDEKAKPATAQLIADAGFEPADLGDIDDSQLQEPGSALRDTTLDADEAEALAKRVRANGAAADPLTAPFEKLRDHAPDDPAFFFDHLSRAVFQARHQPAGRCRQVGWYPGGIPRLRPGRSRLDAPDGTRPAPSWRARDTQRREDRSNSRQCAGTPRHPAHKRQHPGYLASFPDARSAAGDLHRRFQFLGDAGVWLLTSAAQDTRQ